MNLSKKWLKDYVDFDATDKEFADALTLSGSKVEGFETEGAELKNIVVGHLLQIEHHPDADTLWICQLDVGEDEPVQIVTSAQNLKVGDYVPVAKHKSVVAGGHHIEKGKLRGVLSKGMMCSVAELGLTVHDFPYAIEDGIFVLGDDCKKVPGMDIHEAIGLNDTVTEFEITSNRPDCLSVIGLARETAATFGTKLNVKEPVVKPGHGDVNDMLKVTIEAPEKCYRYVGAVVENVRVKPSPLWMRERLRASGVRPINNIVDITNYVMLEYGQPMHAFDLRFLKGGEVIVRNAVNGESITTLDGEVRELDDTMLVIADAEKPVAVAGVMGGEYSGIMDDTTTIVFESACFNGASVRRTAKKLGMRTEASARYEKELNPHDCHRTLNRALELVQLLDAGDVVNGAVDCNKVVKEQTVLDFDPEWVNNFIGINLGADEQKKILEALDFEVKDGKIYVPFFRNDIEHKADISEEIARFYGYGNIPNRPLSGTANAKLTDRQKLIRQLDSALIGCGLTEIYTYSFVSPKSVDKIRVPENSDLRKFVVISNPLGDDTSVMRTIAVPSMLDVLSKNYNNRNLDAALYEIATEYISRGTEELPLEKQSVIIGMYGKDVDFYSIKGTVEEILKNAGVYGYDVVPVKDNPTYHPGRCAMLTIDGEELAVIGEIHPDVSEAYGFGTRVYIASISVEVIEKYRNDRKTYTALPKFPALTRDLAFVCKKEHTVLELEKRISNAVGSLLEDISLFDIYEGSQIPKGMKSVAFSLKLRSNERTLKDTEADEAVNRAIKALNELGITLRS
ncbi:MAG: phenylalanine--tRNA ligase subunit beta [Clostridia bacterium]|nr:phenylalanine--tRNA ligase subunit beta [Clostridia bacterium]